MPKKARCHDFITQLPYECQYADEDDKERCENGLQHGRRGKRTQGHEQ